LGEGVLQLTRQKKANRVVGLDIEADGIAAAELDASAGVTAAAIQPLPPSAFREGEITDPEGVATALKELFAQHKLSKRVRLGIGNQRVVVRIVRLPAIADPKQLDAAVRFQAQEQVPMPLDQAILEYQPVGAAPSEEGAPPQMDVVVVAARRDMVERFLEPVRRAGLEPAGIDLSAFAMIRALGQATDAVGEDQATNGQAGPETATLYCSLGDVMNLAVARGRSCLFTRISTAGLDPVVTRLSAETGLTSEHARQWLTYVGLETPLEQLEGDPQTVARCREALEAGASHLIDELRLSLDYYGAQESAVPADKVVVCGPGSAIPGLVSAMEAGAGLPMVAARPPAFAGYSDDTAARLTLAYGLALES
jgi:type IV pilus assembly protein PilM